MYSIVHTYYEDSGCKIKAKKKKKKALKPEWVWLCLSDGKEVTSVKEFTDLFCLCGASPYSPPQHLSSLCLKYPQEKSHGTLPTACFVLKPILSKEEGFVVAVVFKSLVFKRVPCACKSRRSRIFAL